MGFGLLSRIIVLCDNLILYMNFDCCSGMKVLVKIITCFYYHRINAVSLFEKNFLIFCYYDYQIALDYRLLFIVLSKWNIFGCEFITESITQLHNWIVLNRPGSRHPYEIIAIISSVKPHFRPTWQCSPVNILSPLFRLHREIAIRSRDFSNCLAVAGVLLTLAVLIQI